MQKLSIGLLAAVALALASAPADAAKKKKGGKAKAKTEVSKVDQGPHPMAFTCSLNAMTGSKQPKACGG